MGFEFDTCYRIKSRKNKTEAKVNKECIHLSQIVCSICTLGQTLGTQSFVASLPLVFITLPPLCSLQTHLQLTAVLLVLQQEKLLKQNGDSKNID